MRYALPVSIGAIHLTAKSSTTPMYNVLSARKKKSINHLKKKKKHFYIIIIFIFFLFLFFLFL